MVTGNGSPADKVVPLESGTPPGDGRIIADIAAGMTYFDVVRFELEAEAVLQAEVSVIISATDTAARLDRGSLVAG